MKRLLRALLVLAGALSSFAGQAGAVFTSLYSFTGASDGAAPHAPLMQGADGAFYGTTCGTNFARPPGTPNSGTVFKLTLDEGVTGLYSFGGGSDGADPYGGLVQGNDGYLYGTTTWDGTNGAGTVFKMTTNGVLTTLASFTGGVFGGPECTLIQSADGYFYGTTFFQQGAQGSVFKISADGTLTNLYSFNGIPEAVTNGAYPAASLVQAPDGVLYGTTIHRGTNFGGTVFKITTNGVLNTIYSFSGSVDGAEPYGALVFGRDGYLYGATSVGGSNGYGTVFKITTNGALTVLHSFDGGGFRAYCGPGLTLGSDGYLYGTTGTNSTQGTIYRIATNGAFATLYTFTGGVDGRYPGAPLLQGKDGNFYGTTIGGGANGLGTIFRLIIVPDIQSALLNNGALSVTWSVETGGTYQLQFTSDLSSSAWNNLGPPTLATNSSLTASDSFTNSPQRFYRLALSP